MKIAGAVRVIKGQEVLPDGSTLEELGTTDGSTINIVIEPDKEINLTMKLGPKEFTHRVKSSVRVRQLKQQLIDGGNVGFSIDEFQLILSAEDNCRILSDVPLAEGSLPLHLYNVGNNCTLKIVGVCVMINLVNHQGSRYFHAFPKSISIMEMKRDLPSGHGFDVSFFTEKNWAFLRRGERYSKLNDNSTIENVLADNDVVYFVKDDFFRHTHKIPVYYKNKEIGGVGWSNGDTALTMKLRVQQQLGFPVASVDVKEDGTSLANDKEVGCRYSYEKEKQKRIDVS